MVTKALKFELGCQSRGPKGPLPLEHSVLSLNGGRVAPPVDRVLAVIEGPEEARAHIWCVLEQAFKSDNAAEGVPARKGLAQVDGILEQLAQAGDQADVSVAIAVCSGPRVSSGVLGGAAVLVNRRISGAVEGRTGSGSQRDFDLGEADALVLLGRSAAGQVSDLEVRQTIQASDPDNAAMWLATLGSGRARGQSAAIVAAVIPSGKTKPAPVRTEKRRVAGRVPAPVRVAALGAVVVAILAGGFFVSRSPLSSAGREPRPTNLQAAQLQPHVVQLIWMANHGQSDSVVQIGNRFYHRGRKDLVLPLYNVLNPGQRYRWRVRAIYGTQKTAWAPWHSFAVPRASFPWRPVASSPKGTLAASAARSVALCWNSPKAMTHFQLFLTGHHHQIRATFARSELTRVRRSECRHESLSAAAFYSWRVGGVAPGYYEAWTPWLHFRIAAHVKPPVTTPVYTPPVYTPPSTSSSASSPASASPPASSSTATSQPSTTGTSGQSTSSNTQPSSSTQTSPSTTTSAPAPSPPVVACANPPNC
jgi:hypothetical protein